ncbi:MAG: M28 family peptidase [Calditrichaceae bacterium]
MGLRIIGLKTKFLSLIFGLAYFFGLFFPPCPVFPQIKPLKNDTPLIRDIKKHINYLGSDSLTGRSTGTRGARLASVYISKYLKKYNIKPYSSDDTYYQDIPMYGSIPLADSRLLLKMESDSINLALDRDYLLFKSGAQTHIASPVPLVFVGFGIIAPEYDYNDYLSIDVSGKIVVYLEGEPEYDDPAYFDGKNPTVYSYPESKQRIAISRGAIGSIMIPLNRDAGLKKWAEYRKTFSFEDVTLAYRVTGHLGLILNPSLTDKIFSGSAYNFKDIINQVKNHQLRSFQLNVRLSFKGRFQEREFIGRNVAGLIRGSDPELNDTYIILSAHYDHLGIGAAIHGDSIYNGINDNALGVAAVLEIARLISKSERQPRRSVLFLFLTGEEKGLLGSKYYVDHPIVPLYKTIADINVDGIAILDTFKDIICIGCEFSSMEEIVEAIGRMNGLHLSPLPPQFLGFESFARSDQIAFAQGGIPSILISEG